LVLVDRIKAKGISTVTTVVGSSTQGRELAESARDSKAQQVCV